MVVQNPNLRLLQAGYGAEAGSWQVELTPQQSQPSPLVAAAVVVVVVASVAAVAASASAVASAARSLGV